MTLAEKTGKIKAALLTVSQNVGHYKALKKATPYIVWAEDNQAGAAWAGNRMQNQVLQGTVDLFTKAENDPLADAVQDALNGICSFHLNSVQLEDDTGYIHYEWVWEI